MKAAVRETVAWSRPGGRADVSGTSRDAAGERIAGLYGRRLFVLRADLQAADAVILGATLIFGLLILIFRARVPDPGGLLLRLGAWGAAYLDRSIFSLS